MTAAEKEQCDEFLWFVIYENRPRKDSVLRMWRLVTSEKFVDAVKNRLTILTDEQRAYLLEKGVPYTTIAEKIV
jgi:hypothetical protein